MADQPESRTQRTAPQGEGSSTDSIYEEARRCPRCKDPGELVATHPNQPRRGCKVETYECKKEVCIGFGGRWIVQINEDGTIPVRAPGEKEFGEAPAAMNLGKQILDMTKYQLDKGEIDPGSA